MQVSTKAYITALLFSTFVFANTTFAQECNEPSPNVSNTNDAYYDLDNPEKLSRDDKKSIDDLFRRIDGKWQGKVTHVDCRGPDSAPRIMKKSADISAKIKRASKHVLSIDAQKNFTKERSKKGESLTLMGEPSIFNFALKSDSHLIFSEKFRRKNINQKSSKDSASNKKSNIITSFFKKFTTSKQTPNTAKTASTSRLTETIYELKLNATNFTLLRLYYTNGVYVGKELWVMRRQ